MDTFSKTSFLNFFDGFIVWSHDRRLCLLISMLLQAASGKGRTWLVIALQCDSICGCVIRADAGGGWPVSALKEIQSQCALLQRPVHLTCKLGIKGSNVLFLLCMVSLQQGRKGTGRIYQVLLFYGMDQTLMHFNYNVFKNVCKTQNEFNRSKSVLSNVSLRRSPQAAQRECICSETSILSWETFHWLQLIYWDGSLNGNTKKESTVMHFVFLVL